MEAATLKRQGFLIASLLLLMVFFVLAVGILTRQPLRRQAALQALYRLQARELALAGIEDARQRLMGDIHFVPNPLHHYSRTLQSPGAGQLGTVDVTLDYSWSGHPYRVLVISSEATLGPTPPHHLAIYRIQATVDLSADSRTGSGPNAQLFEVIRWREPDP